MSNTTKGGWHPGYIKRIDAKGNLWLTFLTEKYEEWAIDPEYEMVPGRGVGGLGQTSQTVVVIEASEYLALKSKMKDPIIKFVTIDPPWPKPLGEEDTNSG